VSTKKTSSYNKDSKEKNENKGASKGASSYSNKKTGRADKYDKKGGKDFKKDKFKKSEDEKRPGFGKNEKREISEEEKTAFNPFLNKLAHKYKVTCFSCEKEKMVAVEPFEGVPVICDECIVELEARKLIDMGGYQKTKKLKCKHCEVDFYALNESYLLCNTCYDHFSHQIKALRKGLVAYNCKNCDKPGFIHPKTYAEKKKEGDHPVCRDCMNKEVKEQKLEKKKARINKVKKRKKTEE